MSDFFSSFWHYYIVVITVVSFIGMFYLLFSQNKQKPAKGQPAETLDHVWDDDLRELNNPLPRWWLWMFVLTLVFGAVYLVLYPGLGSYQGVFAWSQNAQYDKEVQAVEAQVQPLYDKYLKQPLNLVAKDAEAHAMGERLFLTYCVQCHGSDARGAKGFPNLRDHDWLYGGDPEAIKTTIAQGRNGLMPAWGATLGDEGVKNVVHYVLKQAGREYDSLRAANGKSLYTQNCAGCHSADGKGNAAFGAPNLTDKTWLYGGSEKSLIETVSKGRNGHMPAHLELLGDAKVHLLAAYVVGLPR